MATYNPAIINSPVLSYLNQYANLLLVLVTAVYVVLTWKSLAEFRQASLRHREAQHLQDIKDNVIQPIVFWLGGTVIPRFTGEFPALLTTDGGYGEIPREVSHTLDDPFTPMQHLATPADHGAPDPLSDWTSTQSGRVSKFLYDHAKRNHFPKELREFGALLENLRQLTADLVSFANRCAEDMAEFHILPALRCEDPNCMPEYGNTYLLAAECIHSFLLGRNGPKMRGQTPPPFSSLVNTQSQPLAKVEKGHEPKIKDWFDAGVQQARKLWEASELPQRIGNLLENSHKVRQDLEHLVFSQSLGIDCDLVSGK